MKVAVVTDSTADLPDHLVAKYHIKVIPTILIFGNHSVEDDHSFSREKFYKELPQMEQIPTTAAPSIGKFEMVYQSLFENGVDKIISIHVASALSGVFNAAHSAANAFGDKIKVMDSGQLSMGLGFQVLNAAVKAATGANYAEILNTIEQTRAHIRLIAMLDTLDFVRRSGRVSWTRAAIGNILKLKPFIEVKDGNVLRLGEARTRKKGILRLHEMLSEAGAFSQIAILHTNAEEDAHTFYNHISPPLEQVPLTVNVTPVIGTHVGPNGLGFVIVTNP